jgi:hypothetical protein
MRVLKKSVWSLALSERWPKSVAVLCVGVLVTIGGCGRSGSLSAASSGADAGRVLWTAFMCGEYANLANKPEEATRLFELGYSTGKKFLEAVRNKTVPDAEIRAKVPIGVTLEMSGPTDEFILGRIYSVATTMAYDVIVKHDKFGLEMAAKDWRTDPETQKLIATNEFDHGNCSLIK